jgi:serine phosphatase RsbU (regulator of sigma subunit)
LPHLIARHGLADGGDVVLSVDLTDVLHPAKGRTFENLETWVCYRGNLNVLAASDGKVVHHVLDQLLAGPTPELLAAARDGRAGVETSAHRLVDDKPSRDRYLVGVAGLELGRQALAVVTLAPRSAAVEHPMRQGIWWFGAVAVIVALSMALLTLVLGQSLATARQERRRAEERQALYQISQALQSASGLEDVLQRIADRARDLFRAEGATIAMLDEEADQIVFRSVSSRNPEVAARLAGLRIPRQGGVIGWVVANREGVVVADASQDPRFSATVDKSTGAQTMSLLCAPLIDQHGRCLGAVECVNNLDDPFPPSDLMLLQSLAVTAAAALERAMLLDVEKQQERLRREMDIAMTVQQGLLPRRPPTVAGYDLAGASEPARDVGGDFYDYLQLDEQHLGLVIADVADKGLGAAMFMVMCRSLLYTNAHLHRSPAAALAALNASLVELSSSDLFVTVFYGVLDLASGELTYACAGHNPPLLHRLGAVGLEPISAKGMALGVIDPIKLAEAHLRLRPGDRLVLYTDGITDAVDAAIEAFGLRGLEAVVLETVGRDAAGTVAGILDGIRRYVRDEPQFDDMTLLVLHVDEPAPR